MLVVGAREHNLANVSLSLPKNRLICFTGVSGSGKSSLAFDTLYAEGQRRYIASLSSYARQFMGELPKPDVDQISGLAPSISIQQKTGGWNPRSTVGTITQIHDYARVLFARAGTPHCPECGKAITAQTREQMVARVLALGAGTRFLLLAPRVQGQKGEYRDLFAELLNQGFARARVDGEVIDLANPPALDRYRRHDIEAVVDRLVVKSHVRSRIAEALDTALTVGAGVAIIGNIEPAGESPTGSVPKAVAARARGDRIRDILLSAGYACTACGISFEPPSPQMFSFNSPQGMCSSCDGLGTRYDFDPDLLVPDPALRFLKPCIAAWRHPPGRWRRHIYEGVAAHLGIDLRQPWRDLPADARQALLYGTGDAHITCEYRGRQGAWKHGVTFEGVIAELQAAHKKSRSPLVRRFYEQFMRQSTCPRCKGARLRPQALAVTLASAGGGPAGGATRLNINEASQLPIDRALAFFSHLKLDGVRRIIAEEPLKEIGARLRFLMDVGLDYLTLDRAAPTLAGGESQRIRLASQIGCGLVGVLYVLDEPSIGLHPRDNRRLLSSLERLRDMGNTVVVVEHDRDTMEVADLIVDFGPGPGVRGGQIVAQGSVGDVAGETKSVTGAYLAGRETIEVPTARRPITRADVRPAGRKRARHRPARDDGSAAVAKNAATDKR
ncbi:MAG: excinuclease ABC subunit UvrA [Planctomycetes bacterium]|nr:excinuclease ABC subunit UvrA [Planctomycetota bacterium]